MSRGQRISDSGVDRAALAYSLLPVRFADAVNDHLTISERQRLREGLARVRDAGDQRRVEAIRALVTAVRRGIVFPRPAAHDDNDCPFNPVADHPEARIIEVLERVARRDALEVVVTLCHLRDAVRQELWVGLAPETPRVHRAAARRGAHGELDPHPRIRTRHERATVALRASQRLVAPPLTRRFSARPRSFRPARAGPRRSRPLRP